MSDRENSFSDRSPKPSQNDRYYSERDHFHQEPSPRHTYDGQHPPASIYDRRDSYYATDAYYDAPQAEYRDQPNYHQDRFTGDSIEHNPTETYYYDYSYRDDYSSLDHSHSAQPGSNYSSAYYGDSTESYLQDDSIEDGVWIKESQSRISYNNDDLRDVTKAGFSSMRTTLAGFAGVAAMLGLVTFLAIESAPELSPGEIIAMQDYEGEQPIKTPFNLASLRDCDDPSSCGDAMNANVATADSTNANTTDTFSEITTSDSTTVQYVQSTEELIAIPVNATSEYMELQEIPAATNYQLVSSGSSGSYYESNSFESASNSETQELRVSQQWSNVRSQPNTQGAILTSLAKGTNVSVINQTGNWFEVSVDNGSQTVGYMHKSTVQSR